MIRIILEDVIISQDILMNKHINNLNFKDIISMIFHAVKNTDEKKLDTITDNAKWKNFHEDFKLNLELQNNRGWPKLNYIKNDTRKRLEIFSPTSYNITKNLLILLLRLIYIESFKLNELASTPYGRGNFHEVLTYKIDIPDKYPASDVSFIRLIEILKMYISYYTRIYQNVMMYEYSLGTSILEQL